MNGFPLALYAIACAGVCVWFALVWLWAKSRDNWSLVDAGWAAAPPVFSFVPFAVAGAWNVRSLVFCALIFLWGGRLAGFLHGRIGGGREREDHRYAAMREEWGDRTAARMFGFFQIQAVTVWVLILPAFFVARDTAAYPAWYDIAGAALVLTGITGESVADGEVKRFKAKPKNRGKICERGLWRYSRHPNYFFEWLLWLGFGLTALGAPFGIVALLAPAMMFCLLRFVTGVPLSEARALATKGDAWRDYTRRVNIFFPGPPKH